MLMKHGIHDTPFAELFQDEGMLKANSECTCFNICLGNSSHSWSFMNKIKGKFSKSSAYLWLEWSEDFFPSVRSFQHLPSDVKLALGGRHAFTHQRVVSNEQHSRILWIWIRKLKPIADKHSKIQRGKSLARLFCQRIINRET